MEDANSLECQRTGEPAILWKTVLDQLALFGIPGRSRPCQSIFEINCGTTDSNERRRQGKVLGRAATACLAECALAKFKGERVLPVGESDMKEHLSRFGQFTLIGLGVILGVP